MQRTGFRALRLAAALAALTSAAAAHAGDRLAPLLACRAVTDAAARLACYDRESAALAATPAPAASAAAPATAVARPVLTPEQKFGLGGAAVAAKEAEQGQPRSDVDALAAKLTALRAGADGRYVFTLDNGQVWRQLAPGSDLLLKVGDSIRISRGALGSYLLVAPTQRSCKVARVR